jgi:hypothetical protein
MTVGPGIKPGLLTLSVHKPKLLAPQALAG